MFGALLILLILPVADLARTRGAAFSPLRRGLFFLFVGAFVGLGWIGGQHPETPFLEIGQFATAFYFAYFLIIIPIIGIIENTLMDLATEDSNKSSKTSKHSY